MSNRYLGGLVRGIPLQFTPERGNAANGVFTMTQYMQTLKARTWPIYDPYYGYNVLLLHGNGTNGAQNNTFLDSSTNNFTITRNGNTTQGTFSPFTQPSNRWAVVFPSSGIINYDSSTVGSNFDPGSSDFTMEMWIIPFSTSQTLVNWAHNSGVGNAGIQIGCNGNSVSFTVNSSSGAHSGNTSVSVSYTTWTHLALVRNGALLTLYVNGVSSATASIPSAATVNTGTWYVIAQFRFGGSPTYKGYLSNFRMNFNAVYTSNFTPPTAPLESSANTRLLILQTTQPTKDASSYNNSPLSFNSGWELTSINPFPSLYPYTPAVNGGSGYFDGTGDYLSIADSATVRFGTGNFTIQCWVNRGAAGATHTIAAKGGASTGWVFQVTSSNVLRFTHTTTNIDSTTTIPADVWTHVAVVREGTGTNQVKIYINGVQSGQGTVSTNFTQTEQLNIGADRGNGNAMNGYISGFQYVVGTAETITVPTSPPTSGTVILNFTNAGVIDNTGINNPETVADAQISTTVKIMGDGSLAFDGTGDWLRIADNPNIQLRVSNFTIECWIYLNAIGTARGVVAKGGASTGWLLSITDTNLVRFTHTTTTITSVSSLAASTWYHIAVVREGLSTNQTKIYINGVQDGQGTVSTDFNQTEPMYVGANRTAGDAFNGYIDDLRISRYARYTGSLIPVPNEPFPLNGEPYPTATTLLIPGNGTNGAQNNVFLDSSPNNFTITRNNNTTQGTFTPFSRDPGYWSNFFDGTGDYLATSSTSAVFDMSTGDFTMEAWIYIPTVPSAYTLIMSGASTAGMSDGFVFGLDNTGKPYIGNGVVLGISGATAVQANTWVHVAAVKNGANVQFYTNGTANGSAQAFSPNAAGFAYVGANPAGNERITGYISNARIVKGTAVYTSAFTPPTAPLTAISGTSILTCQSNRFIDNSSNNFAITRNGDVRVTTFQPFTNPVTYSAAVNGGSGYFDGTNDRLTIADNAALRPGTSNFTIEAWVHRSVAGAAHTIFAKGGASTGFVFQVTSTNVLRFTHTTTNIDSTGTVTAGAWIHVAVVREGTGTNQVKLYINGVQDGQGTVSTNFNQTEEARIGENRGATDDFNGYISSFRYVVGTAVYTSSFTPPTAPLTSITNTQLLCNFTNGAIYDASMSSDIETAGDAQISTAVSKFQGSSMYFDGTGDGLKIASTPDLSLSTGNFTIQFWANIISFAANRTLFDIANATVMQIYVTTTGSLRFYAASADRITSSANLELGTWYYIAVIRSSGITRMFVNGTQTGVAYTDSNNYAAGGVGIGARFDVTVGLLGYMSNVHVLKGAALPLTIQFQTSQWQDV